MKTKTEVAVMQPQAKGCLETAEPKRKGKILPQSLAPLTPQFQSSRTVREYLSVIVSHPVCGNMLVQP